jgi:hypothetical protein
VSGSEIFCFWKQIYYNLIHKIFNRETMMHTTNVIALLKAQEMRLNAKVREIKKGKPSDGLRVTKGFAVSLRGRILKSVCVTLWMMHLLKTSILVTRTPLTTLRFMSRAILNQAPQQERDSAARPTSKNREAEQRPIPSFQRALC